MDFSQGDEAHDVFFIQNGKVKLTVLSERGDEAVIAMLGPADFFGEGCVAGQARRFIDYNGGIKIHRSLLIVVLYDQPEIKK